MFSIIVSWYVHVLIDAIFFLLIIYFRVLVGTGRACFETLRPLAYSLLAEIVHHVRGDLTLSQVLLLWDVWRTIVGFCFHPLDGIYSVFLLFHNWGINFNQMVVLLGVYFHLMRSKEFWIIVIINVIGLCGHLVLGLIFFLMWCGHHRSILKHSGSYYGKHGSLSILFLQIHSLPLPPTPSVLHFRERIALITWYRAKLSVP